MAEVAIVDLRYLAESQPSLCIPRVFNNITENRIRQVFDDLKLGKISRIDMKERKSEKGDSFKRVYVHFDKWFWNEDAQAARKKLISGKEIKIVYDNPWFWKVSASKWSPSSDFQERGESRRSRAHIEFEDEPHNKTTDEFGRDLQLKREYYERRRQQQNNDSRERPIRRPDNRRNLDDNRERPYRRREELRQDIPRVQKECAEVPKPRNLELDNPDELTAKHLLTKVNYGNIMPPLRKKRNNEKKGLPVEIVEKDSGNQINELSEEDKKVCEELYGDLEK